jgi:hypothetical protein
MYKSQALAAEANKIKGSGQVTASPPKIMGRGHFGIGQDFILGEKILNPIKW